MNPNGNGDLVAYYRVSTQRQGKSGLGLDAQQSAVESYARTTGATVLERLFEVETGKGHQPLSRRPQLRAALELCRRTGATLVIAKLDRLARNVAFVASLMESGVRFVAADMPEANELTVHIMAAMGQYEARAISERTRAALAAAKERGVVLGAPRHGIEAGVARRRELMEEWCEGLRGVIEPMLERGMSIGGMVDRLNADGVSARRGGRWHRTGLRRVLSVLGWERS